MNNLLGVVLCGGESKRMGRDKGLLEKEGIPWAVYMSNKLDGLHIPVVFSINLLQWESYSAIIPSEQLIIDSVTCPGPLKGLMSVHKKFPDQDLLLLACDMLDLDRLTIRKMIDSYLDKPADQPDFYIYQGRGFAQPFCGIYTAAGLAASFPVFEQKNQRDFSFQHLLKRGKARSLMIEWEGAFRNYNSGH